MGQKQTAEEMPFKSRTQTRDFSCLAVRKRFLEGALGQTFRHNLSLEKLEGFRQTTLMGGMGEDIDDAYAIVLFHNVRAYCRKDTVMFTPVNDPQGTEMFQLSFAGEAKGEVKGYAEPLN